MKMKILKFLGIHPKYGKLRVNAENEGKYGLIRFNIPSGLSAYDREPWSGK